MLALEVDSEVALVVDSGLTLEVDSAKNGEDHSMAKQLHATLDRNLVLYLVLEVLGTFSPRFLASWLRLSRPSGTRDIDWIVWWLLDTVLPLDTG